MEKVMNKQKTFPWLRTFLDKYMKSFPDDCPEDLLQCLLENLNNEMKANSTKRSRKRQKALFETVLDLFLHCWWKILWKKRKMWKESWKKDCSMEINHDFRSKCVAKLLYYIIYLGIILSKGKSNSNWVSRSLQAIQVVPDHNIICSSFLLIQKLKKKFRPSYCVILKNFLITNIPKYNLDPELFVKVIILFRKLKLQLEDVNEKREILSSILKFQAPSTLIPWMASYNLDVEKLKHKNIPRQLFKKSFKDLFEKLKMIIADLESLSFEERQKDAKRRENIDSKHNMNSSFDLLHSSKDFNTKKNKSAGSRFKKRKLKKKKLRTTMNLGKTHSLIVNENSTMDLTLLSPTNINGTLGGNENDVNTHFEETIDHLSSDATQTSTNLLQNKCVINSDSQASVDPVSKVKKHKLKKKKSRTTLNLVRTISMVINENSTMESTSSSPTNISRTLDGNENDANIHNDETIDNLSSGASQTSSNLFQNKSVIDSDSQTTVDKANLCTDNSVITRKEHINLENNSENPEQLCMSFTTDTNLNRASDSIAQNVPMERPYSDGGNDGSSESQSVNETSMCSNNIEIDSNHLTFSQSPIPTCNGNTLVIDCNFQNNSSDPSQSEIRPKKADVSSIKVVINLNNKQCGGLLLQNEHHPGNNQLIINSLDSNTSRYSFIKNLNAALQTAPEVASQCEDYSPSRKIDSPKIPRHMNHKIATSVSPSSIPNQRNKKNLIQENLNNLQVKKHNFLFPPKHAPSTSQRSTSVDGSDFRTPHTSDCEIYSADENNFSTPFIKSPQGRFFKEVELAPSPILASNRLQADQHNYNSGNDFCLSHADNISSQNGSLLGKKYRKSLHDGLSKEIESARNPILKSPRLQDKHEHHSGNDFGQSQADNISSKNGSLSGKKYRSSATQIYSDLSCDDASVSSMSEVSYEETDHSFIKSFGGRSSSESPLKNRNLYSTSHSRMRTVSASSIDCPSNANDSCLKNKAYFCSLHCGQMNDSERLTSKCKTPDSSKRKPHKRKYKKFVVKNPKVYNFRPRRSIRIPKYLENHVLR